jgi:serine protease Do
MVTSHHVIAAASKVQAQFADGQQRPTTLRAIDPDLDLAILTLDERFSGAVEWTDARRLRPGDWLAVVSRPFAQQLGVTVGVLRFTPPASTNDDADVEGPRPPRFAGLDAAVDETNWGSPVIDVSGRLAGLAVATPGVSSRMGLLLPIDELRRRTTSLLDEGQRPRNWLGLWVRPVTTEDAQRLGLEPSRGLLVSRLVPAGPAQEAGLQPDDVLLQFSGQPVDSPVSLSHLTTRLTPGAMVPIQLWRDGATRSLNLRLAPMPQ